MSSLIDLLNLESRDQGTSLRYSKGYGNKEILNFYEDQLRKKLSESSNSRWEIALTIANLARSASWTAYSAETRKLWDDWFSSHNLTEANPYDPLGLKVWNSTNSIYLFTFLKEKFGLGRTTVYNYLEVVDEFATYIEEEGKEPYYSINEEAKYFQFFQLVEMTSLSYHERKVIKPNWTREMIRAYKKELREKDKPKKAIQPAEQVEAEEPPMTEEQQRFAKYSKNDLINEVVKLEKELESLKKQIEVVLTVDNSSEETVSRTEVKRAISGAVEALLKQYNYEINLNGRKQSSKAFAGNVADGFMNDFFVSDSGKKILASKPDKAFKVFAS